MNLKNNIMEKINKRVKTTSLLVLMIFTSLSAASQTTPKLTHSEVVQVAGASTEELMDRAKLWVAENLKTVNLADSCQIVGDLSFNVTGGDMHLQFIDGRIHCKWAINIRDGRYKFIMTDFIHNSNSTYDIGNIPVPADGIYNSYGGWGSNKRLMQKGYIIVLNEAKDMIDLLSTSLNHALHTPTEAQKDDW